LDASRWVTDPTQATQPGRTSWLACRWLASIRCLQVGDKPGHGQPRHCQLSMVTRRVAHGPTGSHAALAIIPQVSARQVDDCALGYPGRGRRAVYPWPPARRCAGTVVRYCGHSLIGGPSLRPAHDPAPLRPATRPRHGGKLGVFPGSYQHQNRSVVVHVRVAHDIASAPGDRGISAHYPNERTFHWLPIHAFREAEDVEAFTQLAKSKVQNFDRVG